MVSIEVKNQTVLTNFIIIENPINDICAGHIFRVDFICLYPIFHVFKIYSLAQICLPSGGPVITVYYSLCRNQYYSAYIEKERAKWCWTEKHGIGCTL